MSWTPNSQWECRSTGTVNGGAGFDAVFGGVDYSQQDNPQYTIAGTGSSAGTTNLHDPGAGFTLQMKGNGVQVVNGGTVVGWFQITAFVDASNVTVDRTLPNSVAMTCYVGGAYKPTQSGFNFNYVAGNKIWLGPGTYTLTVNALSLGTAGTALLPVTVEGYTLVRGDGGHTPVLQFTSGDAVTLLFSAQFNIVKNLTIDALTHNNDAVKFNSTNCELLDCKVINGHGNQVNFATNYNRMSRCELDGTNNTAASGFGLILVTFAVAGCTIEHNTVHNSPAGFTGALTDSGDGTLIQNNIIRNNAVNGLWIGETNFGKTIQFNDIWANGTDGILIRDTGVRFEGLTIKGNILGKNTSYDIAFDGSDQSGNLGAQQWTAALVRDNFFYTTGTGRYHNMPTGSGDIGLLGSPFVDDTGTFDFQLNNGVNGLACLNGVTITFADGVNVGTYSAGALGGAAEAAASGATGEPGTAPVIDEVLFPPDISRGADGGDMFATVVISGSTGVEQRNENWDVPRMQWNVSQGLRTPEEGAVLVAFFKNRRGKARGFRFKNWDDYQATEEVLQQTGANTVQLIKTYSDGTFSVVKNIFKPTEVNVALTMRRNGVNFTGFTLDTTTGIVTLTADTTFGITGITKAASAIVTANSHPFNVGNVLYFSGVNGMTEINGEVGTITAKTTNTFTVNIDSTGFSTYTSGGTAAKYVQPTEVLDWTGEFDIPVRFDTDQIRLSLADSFIREWNDIPVVELLA